MNGTGVERNVSYGVWMIGQAAAYGVETACYYVGKWYRDGSHGFPTDEALTRKWFRKMETCESKGCFGLYRENAAMWLRQHPERP